MDFTSEFAVLADVVVPRLLREEAPLRVAVCGERVALRRAHAPRDIRLQSGVVARGLACAVALVHHRHTVRLVSLHHRRHTLPSTQLAVHQILRRCLNIMYLYFFLFLFVSVIAFVVMFRSRNKMLIRIECE